MRFFCLFVLLLAGCAPRSASPPAPASPVPEPPKTYAGLNSTLWTQTAVEARAAMAQAYQLATLQLDAVLRDRTRSAAPEQSGNFSALPPAIIFDVDETVLDNAPYQARLIAKGSDWDEAAWRSWTEEARADAIPGALRFVNLARRKGVKIFFVTNRGKSESAGTQRNLRLRGFPVERGFDNILQPGEKLGWTSDKSSRRAFIAKNYRIVMLVGDDFNDFVAGTSVTPQKRHEISTRHDALWGNRWIVIPNPQYGSWERSLYNFDFKLSAEEKMRRKLAALQTEPQTK